MKNLISTIESVVARIKTFEGRADRINEADTIRVLVTPIIEALGWNTLDLDEVKSEYRHKPGDDPVDYALFIDGTPVLFVEAKALDKNLNDRKWIIQTLNYANACNVPWAVLTNGQEWRVYKVHVEREAEEKLFYSTRLDDMNSTDASRRIDMLSRYSMAPKPALDKLWRESEIDKKMRLVVEGLPENKLAIRAMARSSSGLTESDVREALRRLKLRADWRDDEDIFPLVPDAAKENKNLSSPMEGDIVDAGVCLDDITAPTKQNLGHTTNHDVWPEGATHILKGSFYCAFGHFDVDTQKIKILSGSTIVKEYRDDVFLNNLSREWKKIGIISGYLHPDGENTLLLSADSNYESPSTAAGIVSCSSRNGWDYWRDRDNNKLEKLRIKKNTAS